MEGSDGTIQCQIATEVIGNNTNSAQPFEDFIPIQSIITFPHGETIKTVKIDLAKPTAMEEEKETKKVDSADDVDDKHDSEDASGTEEDNPDLYFNIRLSDPKPEGAKIKDNKATCRVVISHQEDINEQKEMQQKLLEIYLAEKTANWGKQFIDACILGPTFDEETEEFVEPDYWDAFSHFCAIFWKLFFALVPPAEYGGGYPSFVASLTMIGIVTYIVGDVATVLGCALGIEESVTAITLVALGTSLPDTFASMTAARESDYADAAIGNITGSNSVNVFLGLGIPWLMGSIYWENAKKKTYEVPAGKLAFSVTVFLVVAIICFIILIGRRCALGAELGGNYYTKYFSGIFLFGLWFLYVILSALQAYGIIKTNL